MDRLRTLTYPDSQSDATWPKPTGHSGKEELEIILGDKHIFFQTAKIGSSIDVGSSEDPEGLKVYYYLMQDLKALVFSLTNLHFKVDPPSQISSQHRTQINPVPI